MSPREFPSITPRQSVASPSATGWYWTAPYLAVAIFAVAMLMLVWGLQAREREVEAGALARDARWAEQTMRLHLQSNHDFVQQLARELAEGALDRGQFQVRATQHIANNPALTYIAWVDAQQVVRWTAPFDNTEWIAGDRLAGNQPQAFSRAHTTGGATYGDPYTTNRGVPVIEFYMPVQRGREFLGVVTAVYSLDGIVRHLVPHWFGDKYRLAIIGPEGAQLAANSATTPLDEDLTYAIPFDPPGQGLTLRAVSFSGESPWLRHIPQVLIFGLSLLVVWTLWALRTHFKRRVQVEKERDQLFNVSLDILCILNVDGSFRRTNPAFERILGLTPDALRGQLLLDFLHPEDVAGTVDSLRALARGQGVAFEVRFRCADSQYRWLAWSINPVLEQKRFYAVAHDITRRRAADDALRSEYAFRKAMEESVATGLRAIDREGRVTYVNPAFCEMVGFAPEELLGRCPPFPYWPPEEEHNLERAVQLTLKGEAPKSGFELRIMRKNGQRIDVRLYISPLIDSAGRHTGWMGAMHDITEPRRIRAELEAAHERFVAVLDGLDTAVHVADAGTDEILYANRAFKAIYGFDAVGRNRRALTVGAVPEGVKQDGYALVVASQSLPAELFDGEVQNALSGRWYHLRERAARWVDGRVVRMAMATDITDRKYIEEVNLQQQERLQQTARLITMGEMASTLAHELNQPLAAIANYSMGCVNRLQSGAYRPEDLLAAMQKASFQADRAGKIIRRVREFVKKSEPNRSEVALADVVDDALGFAEIEARKAGVRLVVVLPHDLPRIFADRIMIEQVILNLVKNGIDAMVHTPRHQRELKISAKAGSDNMLEVSVADRGHGIAPDAMEKLFAPFYTTKSEGMGMGLNICRSIIEFHKGRLWAASNPAGGTVFHFTLPQEG